MKTIAGSLYLTVLALSLCAQQERPALYPRVSVIHSTVDPRPEAAAPAPRTSGNRLWRISLLAVAAAQTSDVATSWGKWESNPLLANGQGRFGWKSVAIKPVTSAWLAVEWMPWMKRHRRFAAIVNFSAAGLVGWQAWRNAQIPRPRQ